MLEDCIVSVEKSLKKSFYIIMTPWLTSISSALTSWHSISNKAQYHPDLTTIHVSTAHWVIKITSCWKPTQTRVVSKSRLGYHENKKPRRHSERIASCFLPPGTRRGQICHCQTTPAFCFPSPPTPCCAFVYFPHVSARALRKLQRASVITRHYITACNLRHGLQRPPLLLRSVLGIHLQIKLLEQMLLSNSAGKCFLEVNNYTCTHATS